jgi:hypothetical protein
MNLLTNRPEDNNSQGAASLNFEDKTFFYCDFILSAHLKRGSRHVEMQLVNQLHDNNTIELRDLR